MTRRMAWLALLPLALGACATPGLRGPETSRLVRSGGGTVELVWSQGDEADAMLVARALDPALSQVVRRWGPLREPTRLVLVPDHAALEDAVDRPGFPWLRAWARFDVVFVQAPSSWGPVVGRERALHELLAHELAHAAMYQRGAERESWQRKEIPLWFREGLASVTAQQAWRRVSERELARILSRDPTLPLLRADDETYRLEAGAVYGAAHHAYAFLERRYGAPRVRALLERMRLDRRRFPEAFEATIGLPVDAFEREYLRYLTMGGFDRRTP